ncbi:MAG: ABC transporter ATP-binding protein [Chloroflexia bacterium]
MSTNGRGAEREIPLPPAGGDIIVEARDVQKTYDTGTVQVHALRGVNLQVTRGEMAAIMGPSGCGKTTLLNVMAGLDSIDSGEVLIEGTPLSTMNDRKKTDLRARKMGFVFQFYNLLPVLSAIENVELPMLVSGATASEARKQAEEALALVGLTDRAGHRPAELSGGQQQRVTIARALANKPAIIWADEPTGDLDSETSNDIMDLLTRLNKENRQTFVVVTHSPEVGARADRIVRMRDGVITDYGLKPEAVLESVI